MRHVPNRKRAKRRYPLLIGGAALLGVTALGSGMRRAVERRRRIGRGELRALRDSWTWVDGERWYARVSAESHHREFWPVVLLHGFGISSSYFVPTGERLAPRFDVYAPDLPGHGKSDTPPEPLDIVGLANALRRWLFAMRFDRVSIIANSMGCQVAVELAAQHPELVDRLVLIGPTMDREVRNLRRVLPRFVMGGVYERTSLGLLLTKDYARMGLRSLDELRAMFMHRIEETLPRVTAPVIFVRGEHDRIAPQRWLEELAALTTPKSAVLSMAGAAHAAHYSHADALVRQIEAFLEQGVEGNKTAAVKKVRA